MNKLPLYFKVLILISIISGLMLLAYLYDKDGDKMVKKNQKVTIAYVDNMSYETRPIRYYVEYHYFFNAEVVYNKKDVNEYGIGKAKQLLGKNVLVVFDSTHVNVNRLLLTSSDYKEYNVQCPDSLKWVVTLFEK